MLQKFNNNTEVLLNGSYGSSLSIPYCGIARTVFIQIGASE